MHWPSPPLHGPPPTLPRRSALQMRCTKRQSRTLLWLSPSAWDQLAIVLHQESSVSLSVLSSHHDIFSYKIHMLWIHTSTLTFEFISFIAPLNHMNSYPSSMIWIHTLRQWYEFIFNSIIWIHTYLPWYEFIFVWYSQSPTKEQYYKWLRLFLKIAW